MGNPLDVAKYNEHISGMVGPISYYSCSKKTVRWYKKENFHLLDIAMWNSFFICKYNSNNRILPRKGNQGLTMNRREKGWKRICSRCARKKTKKMSKQKSVHNHILEAISLLETSKRRSKFYKRCSQCSVKKKEKRNALEIRFHVWVRI